MSSDLWRKDDPKEMTDTKKKKKKKKKRRRRINTKNAASSQSYSTTHCVPKGISREGGRKSIDAIGSKKKTTDFTQSSALLSEKSNSTGGATGDRIRTAVRAKIDATKRWISSRGLNDGRIGIAARAKINPRVMMKRGIKNRLVKNAVNSVLRAILLRPHSNPVQFHRRKNFKPTRSRFQPDSTSTPLITGVVAKPGNRDFAREAVSWLMERICPPLALPAHVLSRLRSQHRDRDVLTSPSVIISSYN